MRAAFTAAFAATLLLAACAPLPPAPAAAPQDARRLCLIGTATLASGLEYQGTTVGGLSGIDYDAARGLYLLISDDRSGHQSARAYTARLRYTAAALAAPELTGVITLRHENGQPFPDARRAPPGMDVPDAEAVRWRPGGATFLWTSEGDFARGFGPQLRESRADGASVRNIALPPGFAPTHGSGPRDNGTLEGLALTPDGRTAWLAMEEPWKQDGPLPTPAAQGGPVRFTAIDVDSGRALRQIAYQPGAVPQARRVPVGPEVNGVSEVLADGPHHLLVLERAYSAGAGVTARLYRIDTRAGSDTLALGRLAPGNHQGVPKTLVADLDALAGPIDNIEGMAWGAPLEGTRTRVLVFVSDDNFNPAQTTQFIAAAYLEPGATPPPGCRAAP